MRIVQVEPPHFGAQGDHIYRTVQPGRALSMHGGVEVVSGTGLSGCMSELMEVCDVLVFCDAADLEHLPLIERRRARGLVSVYEINDHFLSVHPWSPTSVFYGKPANRSLILQLARECDGVQFSMPELQKTFGHLNAHSAVFPNNLWEPAPKEVEKPAAITVGWGGSRGHLEDVQWMLPSLQWMMQAYPSVHLSVMSDEAVRPLFAWAPEERFQFRAPAGLEEYLEFVSGLHIGLAPLLSTEFNRCRSDVKYLEYASRRVTPVCSDDAPYRFAITPGENGVLFGGPQELQARLSWLLEDIPACLQIARSARDYVCGERLERQHSQGRLDFYEGLLRERGAAHLSSRGERWERLEKGLQGHRWRQEHPDSRYTELLYSEGEGHLYNALLSQGDPGQALEDLDEAVKAMGVSPLSLLYTGALHPDRSEGLKALEEALEQEPCSLKALLLLGETLEDAGLLERARETYERFSDANPAYAPVHEHLGRVLEKQGEGEAARGHYERALSMNRDYRVAAYRLIHLHLEEGALDAARALAEDGLTCLGAGWMDAYLAGRVYCALKDPGAAAAALERAWSLVESGDASETEDSPAHVVLGLWARVELDRGDRVRAQELLETYKAL